MKYTFEIMKEYEDAFKGISVYSVSEDKKLMVDFVAIEELEDAQKEIDEAYQRGLDDAWECAKKLFSTMSDAEIEKVFPVEWKSGFSGLMQMKPQYAMAKIKAYEEKQNDKIEVGDEVNWLGDCFIVTRIFQPHNMKEQCDGIDDDGCVYRDILMDDLEKTGRHFDIEKILEDMRND